MDGMSPYGVRMLAGATLLGALLAAILPFPKAVSSQTSHIGRYWVCALDPGRVVTDNGTRALVTLREPPQPGTRILIRARMEPLDEARNPGEPSERSIQAERGITAQFQSATILAHDASATCPFEATLSRLRALALKALRTYLAEPGASIVAGELWGDRSAMSPQLRAEFQETGTVHVLVTAGLHVGFVAALLVAIFRALTMRRTPACVFAMAIVWCFAFFSGGNLPALRAASMVSVFLVARVLGRAAFSWNTLSLAAIVVLLIEPPCVATPSFWLSFSCVGAIFALSPHLERWFEHLDIPDRVREALTLTVATQVGTWPITAAVFLQFSTYGIIANLLVVPLVPLTMALGAAQLIAMPAPPVAQAVANLNAWPLAWSAHVVELLATLPGAAVPMSPAPTWCIVLYEASILGAATLLRVGNATAAIGTMLFSTSLVLFPPAAPSTVLRITMLDVGQADAIVIETPAHHTILVDAGGRLERGPQGDQSVAELVGERIVVPFLLRRRIHEIDALIVSHPHGDHVGGCKPVLDKIHIAEIADSGQAYGGHAYHDCLDAASADRVPIVLPRAGEVWRTNDGVTLTFIGPSLPFIGGKNAINDNSIAFIVRYKQFRMLFTGDAGIAAERRFLDEGIDLHADVQLCVIKWIV